MELIPLIIQAVSGLVGGTAVGSLARNLSAGGLGNSIAGLVGGVAGGQLLGSLMSGGGEAVAAATEATGGMDIGALLGDVAGGVGGGAILTAIVGVVKNMMAK